MRLRPTRRSTPHSGPVTIGFFDTAREMWGAEASLFTLAASLRDQGHTPVLVAWSDALTSAWTERELGPAVTLPGVPVHDRISDLRVLAAHRRLLPRLDAVVIFSYMLLPAVPLLRVLPQLRGAAFAFDLHDQIEGGRGRAMLQGGVVTVDSVIAVSRFTTEQTRHRQFHVINRPLVPPTGSEPQPPAQHPGPLRVGIIGRLDHTKKQPVAIDAVTLLAGRAELLIRGEAVYVEPSYQGTVDAAIAAAAAAGVRITIEGTMPTAQAFAGLDVVVVCNDREPMGRTVAEAQLRAIPVVVPSTGGSSELVQHGVTGLHFAPNDPGSLASQLDALAKDPALAAQLGRAGAAAARPRHDPATYARTYLDAAMGRRRDADR